MKQEIQMSVTVKNAARALAVGFVLAAAGSAPAWSQTAQDPYAGYQGNRPAQWYPTPYGGAYYQGNPPAQWYPLPDGGASAHPYTGR
jgi:hypothetical protein